MELEDKIGRVSSAIPDHVERQRAEGRKADLAFEWALKDGYVRVNRGRIMLIGQDRAGKTSLMKNLLGLPFDPNEQSTEGIEVNPSKCEIDVERVRNWQPTDENKPGLEEYAKEVAKIIAEKLVRRHGKDSEDNAGEDSEDSPLEDSFDDEVSSEDVFEEESVKIYPPSLKRDFCKAEAEENKGSKFSQYSKEENLPNEPEAQINASSPPDDIRRHLHLWLEYVKCKGDISREVVQSLDIWDFAGQHLYYASYPIFLSPRALYILVHNLSKPLDALAEPCVRQGMIDVELKNPNNETNVENLLSWLATVHSLAQVPINEEKHDDSPHKLPYLRPPVLIVGTHADKPVDGIALMKKHIEERIFHKEYDKHVIRPLFCIDNTRSSSKQLANESNGDNSCGDAIDSLQNRIIEVLNKEPYMEEKIPVRWFLFEKVIEALVDKQIYHSSLRQLQDYAEKWCFVEDSNEFNSMISFYHDLGLIIKHRSTVVLKAQWLIDLFKQLIIIPRYNDMVRESPEDKWS
ncbi:uncharacterized protein LOC111346017 [Stylophora pistillata]|uniref:uncharacterized protein LOC111346017 n=1 Tax=Stylophora pistillata TaxID=50429 RepID=UPI000C0547F2|nr:uncharacterized protein LOC111346017 [Stylophora pistillata]